MSLPTEEQKPPPTPEEIAAHEAKMTEYYTKKLPLLRLRAEYDMKQADIAEARIRILIANSRYAEATAPAPEEEKNSKKDS